MGLLTAAVICEAPTASRKLLSGSNPGTADQINWDVSSEEAAFL